MKITVFTPTYNRAYIIENLYQSLKAQTYTDFEWLVIDDGSSDNTEELIKKYISEDNKFSIHYEKKENGGKHRAINYGLPLAKGELFFIVDSDDFLPDNALETIVRIEQTIPKDAKKDFAGICGIKSYTQNGWVGSTFEEDCEVLDITHLEREKYNILGDKAEVYYKDVFIKYPSPEFEGEKYMRPCAVLDRIANDGYKIRYFNEVIYYCEYLEDGLTKNGQEVYKNNPQGIALIIHQDILFKKYTRSEETREILKYVKIHKDLPYSVLAKYLHISKFKLYTYIVKGWDIKHLPNRIVKKIIGQKNYSKLKDRIKRK